MRSCFVLCLLSIIGCNQSEKLEGEDPIFNAEPGSDDSGSTANEPAGEEPSAEPETDCPDGIICTQTFPFVHSDNTQLSNRSDFDSYGCASSTDESGPEIVYRFTLPHDGFLALELSDMESGADVDIHLLSALDSGACIDRGHWLAGSWLAAGTYWVVADSWVNSSGTVLSGSYTLRAGLSEASDLAATGMREEIAEDALVAFDHAWVGGEIDSFLYAVTDFSLHSSNPRMWIYDLAMQEVVYNLHVAHGSGSNDPSDSAYASRFSNVPNSYQSSLGMMRGGESYTGTYGYSMRIDGLETGYNDNVRSRAIVLHGWEGARPEYVAQLGETSPTLGCPAVDDREVANVVDLLKDGAGLFFWYQDSDWYQNSEYLGH